MRTTHPLDALDPLVLRAVAHVDPPGSSRPVPSRREEHTALLLQQREVWRRRTVRCTWSDLAGIERRRNRIARFDGPAPF